MHIDMLWATDIHLDWVKDVDGWVREAMTEDDSTHVLLTGDISIAPKLVEHLRTIRNVSKKPVYFVLGNHDFWDGSFEQVRKDVSVLSSEGIHWMGGTDVVRIGDSTALVGHDCWYDAGYGNHKSSTFVMNDWARTSEFVADPTRIVEICREQAKLGADHIRAGLDKAIKDGLKRAVVLTHVPPFEETCFYNGRRSPPGSLPWFSSRTTGDMLLEVAHNNPTFEMTVLCGHTHSYANYSPRKNLRVLVGSATYGVPSLTSVGVTE